MTIFNELKMSDELKIGIVGLGYVGLPLAVEFGKHYFTTGFDLKVERIAELKLRQDSTREVSSEALKQAKYLYYTSHSNDLADCNFYIITVPTPLDLHKCPDLTLLKSATDTIGQLLNPGDIVIYESTVYPGATEEICVPLLEQKSTLKFNEDFFVGYSPERINPGDKDHRLTNIIKVTSGSTPEVAELIDELYRSIIHAGTHQASSIRVAEAAKVIENTQRDVNIALVNELALIFNRLGIDTQEVLEAAGTKWNFLPFRPGLVGGHCIGVDPYYLTQKASDVGYHPEVILAGRRINDNMGFYIAAEIVKQMIKKRIHVTKAHILVMGLTFKENCPDLRNSRVIDIIQELSSYGANIDVYDPWANSNTAKQMYKIELVQTLPKEQYDAVVLAVAHQQFSEMGIEGIRTLTKTKSVVYDIKSILPIKTVDGRL
ncbi:Vi polysaccharide biosynthesis UDP-N-acetylglucosamine C-6 dehydrogenase TviB [Candidatus Parabeggiatoa sp. HSG14]|uniref:Vi polysaccharide biosynthesis UDP-N-acetylglucosamine C-6 dehydrogenase TviB n=1 Tax=Candidatus Parabeggiatoa sp. HSG14 TaxID=3055593 RepID=UPI0025A7CDFB|nr:Vi polysaccharide biosynthesis UDP-N-acetylglucosamine C-6 dehydrogenase TviB [Thiotrichales bacterium HSG14]